MNPSKPGRSLMNDFFVGAITLQKVRDSDNIWIEKPQRQGLPKWGLTILNKKSAGQQHPMLLAIAQLGSPSNK